MEIEGGEDVEYTEVVKKAIVYIHDNYNETISVIDIANYVFLSPSHLSTVFRMLTNYTIKNYLINYRLYRAALELKETNKRIVEISYENGFSSQQAFSKSFSQRYGIPPAKFVSFIHMSNLFL